MRTRKQVVVSLDEKNLKEMEKVREEFRIPISRQLELAWLKVKEMRA